RHVAGVGDVTSGRPCPLRACTIDATWALSPGEWGSRCIVSAIQRLTGGFSLAAPGVSRAERPVCLLLCTGRHHSTAFRPVVPFRYTATPRRGRRWGHRRGHPQPARPPGPRTGSAAPGAAPAAPPPAAPPGPAADARRLGGARTAVPPRHPPGPWRGPHPRGSGQGPPPPAWRPARRPESP